MKTCFFIGHRDAPQEIMPVLCEAIERHITEYGVTNFVVGRYGRFDSMAAQALCEAKQRYYISIHLLLPYHPSEMPVNPPDGFTGTLYVLLPCTQKARYRQIQPHYDRQERLSYCVCQWFLQLP